ncbi:MAG: hypothetical protein ACK5WZ_04800, partial [Pseudobdellovibrionaceae bacterium]
MDRSKNLLELGKILIFGISLTLVVACAKSRNAEIKDQQLAAEIFEISTIQNTEFSLQTGQSTASAQDLVEKPQADFEKPKAVITSASVPSRMQKLFNGLAVSASQQTDYKIVTSVGAKTLNVFKVVRDEAELTVIEKGLVQRHQGKSLVLLFQSPIKKYGRLVKVKNENNEETSVLNIEPTDFENATHVQIDLAPENIIEVGGSVDAAKQLSEIFLADRLNKKVSTLENLKSNLNFSLQIDISGKVYSLLNTSAGSSVELLIYKILKKSDILDQDLLRKLDSNVKLGEIGYCPAEVLQQISAEEQKDCVIVLGYSLRGEAVRATQRRQDLNGNLSTDVEFESVESSQNAQLIRFSRNVIVQQILVSDINSLNPSNTFRVEDLRDKEFLLRRTFEDASAGIQYFGPGASGEIDIVKFEFEDRRVVVRKQTVVNGDSQLGNFDKEELMSIPVRYLGVDLQSKGINPKLIDVNKETAKYILLNWANNTVQSGNSPLMYYGTCFAGVGSKAIADVDNRISEGILNFSISGSYSFTDNCMSYYGMQDYWYGGQMQTNFNIRERVSFKLHDKALDLKKTDVPFR